MHFAYPLPWWLALLLAAAIAVSLLVEYRRTLAPLTRAQRGILAALRALTLTSLVAFLFRPIAMLPPSASRGAIVPVIVDASRSMRIADVDGRSRISAAATLIKERLMPALTSQFSAPLYRFGDGLTPAGVDTLSADARRTDLAGALNAVRDRYRGQRVAGIVVVSDGGDTGDEVGRTGGTAWTGPPVFAIGMGSPDGPRDREVLGVTAGDPRLDHSSIDLHVTASSTGYGRTPFQLQVTANGQPIESRRVVPSSDGSPIDAVFTVSPDPMVPTVFTAQIASDEGEAVSENNRRSVLVSPAGRKRRLLVVEGAPGFEHSFMTRAWSVDPSLEIDTVTRKGKNTEGQDTFFVQAGAGRAAGLTGGFPAGRDKLFFYDAVVVANVESDFFTKAQMQATADFVSERGGGLLVLGGRSFAQRGLSGTPLEEVLPVELDNRRGVLRATMVSGDGGIDIQPHNKMTLTAEGEAHPVMRIGATLEETRKRWTAMPALAASAPLGGPRPGATVLALTAAPGGGLHPVVAVQRYGHGRSMIFAGEASWRWKMMVASTDRAFEFFWRQAARWLTSTAPDPIGVSVPDAPEPGDSIPIDVFARDASFAPALDATIDAALTPPGGGAPQPLKMRRADDASGRFSAAVRIDQPGLYRITVDAKRGAQALGSADRWMYVGGADREFADPRLNEALLRRLARTSGGRYVRASDASRVADWLKASVPQSGSPERRDLWHEPWAFALVAALICAEWILRRRWGLR